MNDTHSQLYEALSALSESAFPKRCPACARSYASAQEFIDETRPVRQDVSGLKQSTVDEPEKTILELYRNCACGSTLMDYFDDRRKATPEGRKRRELFELSLNMLRSRGVEEAVARAELIKYVRGQESPFLQKLGFGIR
jgi:hypothetical protein